MRIYRLLFVFCLFVCYVCTVTDFFGEDKASGIKFCTAVHGHPGQGMSHFGELCSPTSLKSDESVTHPKVKFRVQRASVIACLSISRGVWTQDRHVWIYGRPQTRTHLLFFDFQGGGCPRATGIALNMLLINTRCSEYSRPSRRRGLCNVCSWQLSSFPASLQQAKKCR